MAAGTTETLGSKTESKRETGRDRLYLESHRKLSAALWAAALKLVWPVQDSGHFTTLNVARLGSHPALPPWVT